MARRKRRHYQRRSLFKIRLKKETIYTVCAVCFFGGAGILFLSLFKPNPILEEVFSFTLIYFGWGAYFLPFVLASLGLLFFKIKTKFTTPNVSLGLSITFFSLLSLTQAGVIGSEVWSSIEVLISAPGAFLILFGTLIIGITVLFNTSLDELLILLLKIVTTTHEFVKKHLVASFFEKKKKPIFVQEKKIVKKPLVPPPVLEDLGQNIIVNPEDSDLGIWESPSLSLLAEKSEQKADRGDIKQNAAIIEKTLESFGIKARVVEVNLGPAVTQYALEIALGTKLSKITALGKDLALALAAPTGQIRIEAPIPGRSLVGIEIPNRSLEFVFLKTMLESEVLRKAKSKLSVGLGLDVAGNPVVADIGKMPHVLIAGTTGSGKSVLINSWISCLLFRTSPSDLKLILVDPKRVELTGYNGVPHLLVPIIVDIDKILSALKWALSEMDRRYKQFAKVSVRNIDGFNELAGFQALPYIVIFIDELADLMAYAPVEVEDSICRIAQMARATGIHLVVSTQRPSVDVITGLIKANIPCRIAFSVSSMVDSRVIIDLPGAEKLLGRGDMLYIPPSQAKPTRIQGTFVSEKEVQKLVEFLKRKGEAKYEEEVTTMPVSIKRPRGSKVDDGKDELFEDALRVVCQYDRASASLLQRRLSIGYARAARILDQLEAEGIVGLAEGSKPREVLLRNAEEYFAQQES